MFIFSLTSEQALIEYERYLLHRGQEPENYLRIWISPVETLITNAATSGLGAKKEREFDVRQPTPQALHVCGLCRVADCRVADSRVADWLINFLWSLSSEFQPCQQSPRATRGNLDQS